MTEKTPGAETLVREGAETFAWLRDLGNCVTQGCRVRAVPCVVRHPDAGGLRSGKRS